MGGEWGGLTFEVRLFDRRGVLFGRVDEVRMESRGSH
jgi:hypothetical protein